MEIKIKDYNNTDSCMIVKTEEGFINFQQHEEDRGTYRQTEIILDKKQLSEFIGVLLHLQSKMRK